MRHLSNYCDGLKPFLLSLLLLVFLAASSLAQNAPPAAEKAPDQEDLPILLFVPQRVSSAPARRDDMHLLLRDTLREVIEGAQKFSLFPFSPTSSRVKQALREHILSASDLIEPIKPETLQRLARAVGARYVLSFSAVTDATSLKTDVRLLESVGQQDWRTLFAEDIHTARVYGKKRLNPKQTVSIAVDAIASRMGIPSHLTQDLNLEQITKANDALRSKQKDTPPAPEPPKATAKTPPPEKSVPEKKDTTPKPEPEKKAAPKRNSKPEKTAPPPPAELRRPEAKPVVKKPDNKDRAAAFTPDTAPGRAATPPPPVIAPPIASERPDNEAQAVRFRQAGDIANVITSLRRAINERPRDVGLRRQLVQAYRDRSMPEAALAEATRALQLDSNNSGLHRLYGDALLAQGDMAGAMKAYRQAMQIDPSDVAAQVALGDALLSDNQFTEAVTAYQAAIKNDPKSPLPHRRLARALAGRAASDSKQYIASLEEIQKARSLTPPTDTETYLEDYVGLMRVMEGRLRETLDQVKNTYQAYRTGKRSLAELQGAAADMQTRAEAAADYLDKLPPAAGQDVTHAHYQQSAALVLQAVGVFHDLLAKGSTSLEEMLKSVELDALRTLDTASKRLETIQTAQKARGGS